MKLLTFTTGEQDTTRFGAVVDGGVCDLTDAMGGASNLDEVISSGRIDEARAAAGSVSPRYRLDEITYERTLQRPGKIFCIGVNYGGRNAEYKDDSEEKSFPSVFVRFPASFTGHDQDLVRPPESPQLDYEGEIVAVIAKRGRRIPASKALSHIAGLTLGNEGTIRDWVRHAKFNVTQGKNWERSGSIGPWMVTMDEIADFEALHLTTTVNGELRQDDTPATMKFPIEYQIEYLSTFCTLEPGDIIFTGTPTGAGARFQPPRFLSPGDVVEVNVPEIGTLRNGIRDE